MSPAAFATKLTLAPKALSRRRDRLAAALGVDRPVVRRRASGAVAPVLPGRAGG